MSAEAFEIRGARLRDAHAPVGVFEGLDPVDQDYVLRALDSQPKTTQRMRVLSWLTLACAKSRRDAVAHVSDAIDEALREDTQ